VLARRKYYDTVEDIQLCMNEVNKKIIKVKKENEKDLYDQMFLKRELTT